MSLNATMQRMRDYIATQKAENEKANTSRLLKPTDFTERDKNKDGVLTWDEAKGSYDVIQRTPNGELTPKIGTIHRDTYNQYEYNDEKPGLNYQEWQDAIYDQVGGKGKHWPENVPIPEGYSKEDLWCEMNTTKKDTTGYKNALRQGLERGVKKVLTQDVKQAIRQEKNPAQKLMMLAKIYSQIIEETVLNNPKLHLFCGQFDSPNCSDIYDAISEIGSMRNTALNQFWREVDLTFRDIPKEGLIYYNWIEADENDYILPFLDALENSRPQHYNAIQDRLQLDCTGTLE